MNFSLALSITSERISICGDAPELSSSAGRAIARPFVSVSASGASVIHIGSPARPMIAGT
ncbi:hypothetical protein [Mesorhizobium sp. NBIMC_P2-C3]|uniref:hypothetical protein n=1 Tax=Mesorhizobium sp. NBIMC_P2-C3 TaxID=1320556 RepID=UPI001FCB5D15|nr:hypothetical protein [Mesorhizobium sp. NBIMC_P2-C3]